MHKELFEHSPLLMFPLVAMFVFISVWVAAAVRAMTGSSADLAAAARLPLDDETSSLNPPQPRLPGRFS
jgi:hypothetical protein